MPAQKHIALLVLFATLTACGGGGSDDKPKSSSSVVAVSLGNSSISSSTQSSVSVSTQSSSLSSSQSSLSQSSTSAVAKTVSISGNLIVKNEDGIPVENLDADTIRVDISLLDADQQTLESNISSAVEIGGDLGFSGQLTASDAQFVVVHISKQGFTDYARRFEFTEKIELQAELSELPTAQVSVAEAQTISGEVVNGFNFSVTDNLLGESDSADGKELSVFIPESALPVGTTSLDVQMKAFDPTNPAEAAYFPGAYEDSDGNKLLSIAFNYTDVKTNQGVSLMQVAQQARTERIIAQKTGRMQKTDTDPVIINRTVPVESCRSLATMGDSDASQDGFQIPVYTYNPVSGLWDLLGQGSLFNEAGNLLAANFTAFDCDSVDYMLEIKVTNEIFISNWWNLDYPLVFEEPVELCAKLKLLDEGGMPLVGANVYAFDDDDYRSFSATSFISDLQGEVKVSLVKLDDTDADTSVKIRTYSTATHSFIDNTITLSTAACESTAVAVPVTLSVPARCAIDGKVLNSNSTPAADVLLVAIPDDEYEDLATATFGRTDSTGNYAMNLSCDVDYDLGDYLGLVQYYFDQEESFSMASINVNGVKSADEITDDGKKVIVKDLTHVLGKPWGLVTTAEDDNEGMFVDIYYAGTDFPVTYQFDLVDNETNQVVKHFQGTLNESDFVLPGGTNVTDYAIASFTLDHGLSIPEGEPYLWLSVKGDATDAESNKGLVWGAIFLSTDVEELE